MDNWKAVLLSPETSLFEAISQIDACGIQVGLVANKEGKLEGILTDGDIRRAILQEKNLQIPVSKVMNCRTTTASPSMSRSEVLTLMRSKTLHHVPLVDEENRIIGLLTLDELVGARPRENWVILMAGGQGKRLRPLTEHCPKPLLSVAGKPILDTILGKFSEQGFRRIFISVNYKAEMIQDYCGTGERWGIQIEYLHENQALGTAGALSLLPEKPESPMIVMNADLLTHADFDGLLGFHREQNAVATMAVREYDFQVPYGVIRLEDSQIQSIEEKPVQRFFVNTGIYALSPEALDHLPSEQFFDMTSLFEQLIDLKKITSAYPLREYWLDIGRLEEFERAEHEWPKEKQ